MSNPEPDLSTRRERRRHIGPFVGMALVVLFALGLMVWWLGGTMARAPGPGEGPGLSPEESMAPPASPGEGGAEPQATEGDTGGTDAVGDPSPVEPEAPADAP